MHNVKKIGIVGAGQMGGGIAQVGAVSGFEIRLQDAFAGVLDKC